MRWETVRTYGKILATLLVIYRARSYAIGGKLGNAKNRNKLIE